MQALAGANLLVNISASNEMVGKHAYLRSLIEQQSARTMAAYLYSSAGLLANRPPTLYLPETA